VAAGEAEFEAAVGCRAVVEDRDVLVAVVAAAVRDRAAPLLEEES
jgi:hypothetical protein